ncbi:MAG TPA: N-formylglutamate deformylase [Rhizomicrobium sp.]|nr:N-formylglutamate deformylase [Rhizomicrobium sp.]
MNPHWLEVRQGTIPLVVSFPHTGTDIPGDLENTFLSPWLARRDADWWVDRLYDFAGEMGATTVRTSISRSVIDVNRDPSGASLYPGQATTDLCPTTTFDGEALYREGCAPDDMEIARRRETFFTPYHNAVRGAIDRLRALHPSVVLFDAHSIRSRIPRLFEGELPQFNIGTNSAKSCAIALTDAVEAACAASSYSRVLNGRFKGGWTTRHYGEPSKGIHAIQLELACRGYIDEPNVPAPSNWPTPYDEGRAKDLRGVLKNVLRACVAFTQVTA